MPWRGDVISPKVVVYGLLMTSYTILARHEVVVNSAD